MTPSSGTLEMLTVNISATIFQITVVGVRVVGALSNVDGAGSVAKRVFHLELRRQERGPLARDLEVARDLNILG